MKMGRVSGKKLTPDSLATEGAVDALTTKKKEQEGGMVAKEHPSLPHIFPLSGTQIPKTTDPKKDFCLFKEGSKHTANCASINAFVGACE